MNDVRRGSQRSNTDEEDDGRGLGSLKKIKRDK